MQIVLGKTNNAYIIGDSAGALYSIQTAVVK